MENIMKMTSKVPLPTISSTITGTATIGPPPVPTTVSSDLPIPTSTAFPPIPHKVFEHATKSGHIVLWIMFAAMIIVTLIFMLMTLRVRKPLRLFHYITILITLTSGLVYFIMAAGGGWRFSLVDVIHHKHQPTDLVFRQIYWARYIGWLISTILILLDLTLLAGLPGAEILLVIYADVAMMLFALFSAFEHRALRWGYYTISLVFYLYIVFTLFLSSRRAARARHSKVGRLFTALSTYTIIIWALYFMVGALGHGPKRISINTEIVLFAVLDVLSQALFGGWLLLSHLWVQEGHVPITGWWIEGAGTVHSTAAERRGLLDDD